MRKVLLMLMPLVAAALLILGPGRGASGQGLDRRFSIDELNQMVTEAKIVVRARASAEPVPQVPQGNASPRLAWRVPFEVLEVLKGECSQKTIQVRVNSPTYDLKVSKRELPGKVYLLTLVPLSDDQPEEFRLVASTGFPVGSPEATRLLEITQGKVAANATVTPLRLQLTAERGVAEVGTAVQVKVMIQNPTANVISYDNPPIELLGNSLVLRGGQLDVTDGNGAAVMPKPTLVIDAGKPETAGQTAVLNDKPLEVQFDLAQYFDLSRPGKYLVKLSLPSPDGKEMLRSTGLEVQVINRLEVELPASPVTGLPQVSPADPSLPVAPTPGPLEVRPPTADTVPVPSPESYAPGEPVSGLSAFLKPVKAKYAVGEKIALEFRLINRDERPLTIDVRLERTIQISVQPQLNSPAVTPLLRSINWPADDPKKSEFTFAYLRPMAFWGKIIDINSFYGKTQESLLSQGESVPTGPGVDYENYGMTLFAFENPGVYKVQATYVVKPRSGEGTKVWAGKAVSNPVFIRVTGSRRPMADPRME